MMTYRINELKDIIPNLSPVQSDYFAESCVVALENQGHKSGVVLKVEGDIDSTIVLEWQPVLKLSGWKELRDIAENGAIAIAFLLVNNLTPYKVVQQAVIGTGFDYWLGFREDSVNFDPDNFLNASLEVSGINKGSKGVISKRVKERVMRTGLGALSNIPGFIIVTEFGEPISFFIEK